MPSLGKALSKPPKKPPGPAHQVKTTDRARRAVGDGGEGLRTEVNIKGSQDVAAADVDDFAGNVAGLVRREKCDDGRNVRGLAHAAQWNLRHLLLADRLRDAAGHDGVNKAGADRVDRHLGGRYAFTGRSAEPDHA